MRATLDSVCDPTTSRHPAEPNRPLLQILERRPGPPTPHGASSIRRPSVPVVEDKAEDHEHEEVPHTPSTTHSAAADRNDFRLDLDLENMRFSCGDVLRAMNAAGESALARRSAVPRNTTTAGDAFARASARPQSLWESDYVVVSNMMSLDEDDDDASEEFSVDDDDDELQLARRRPQSPLGQAPQAWRHAIYISKLVWPAQRFQTMENVYRNKPLPPVVAPPKSRWAEAGMFVRKLSLKRS